ncbi:MAG: ferric reductase-like transmembrane domain-containing protein [Beijerinckiaceae bacterium]|nr:ferric reductase-like transmembrane domain-containing protein [Beijerinckiaceae bacterium]
MNDRTKEKQQNGLATVVRHPLGVWSGGRELAWVAAYLALVSLPLVLLLLGEMPPAVGFWWDFSMGLGFAGLAVIGMQFALTARFPRLTSPFGIDVIYVFHRYLAWVGMGLVAAHFSILWLFHHEALGALNPLEARWELTSGRVSLTMFALAVVTSQWRKALKLEYGLWRYAHVAFATLGFGAAVAHILGVGNYTSTPTKAALWLVVTLSWLCLILWVRLFKPWRQMQTPYRVQEVRPEAAGAITLVLEPDGHEGMPTFKAGQFAWLTIGANPFLLREHPFSIASAPEALPRLCFGIKALGDFTSRLRDIAPGETAYLDGPYGVFSVDSFPHAAGYAFIVGGIGVTPAISMLRSLAARGDRRPLWLFYGNNSLEDVIYGEELDDLASRLDLRVIHVVKEPPEGWEGESGFLDGDILARHLVDDKSGLVFFLCGPPPMTKAAREALLRLGVRADSIRAEIFELV